MKLALLMINVRFGKSWLPLYLSSLTSINSVVPFRVTSHLALRLCSSFASLIPLNIARFPKSVSKNDGVISINGQTNTNQNYELDVHKFEIRKK